MSTICRMAMSRDFFEIVRPNPVLSVDDIFAGFRDDNSLLESTTSFNGGPLESVRLLPVVGSASLPLLTTGDDCRLATLPLFVIGSAFPFAVRATPGLDLPADIGLSGKLVLRFGGISCGKSWSTIGCGGARTRGPGELGRETEVAVFPFVRLRPPGVDGPDTGEYDGAEFRRVGVDGLDVVRGVGELKFAEI